jgi:hypothetical protein
MTRENDNDKDGNDKDKHDEDKHYDKDEHQDDQDDNVNDDDDSMQYEMKNNSSFIVPTVSARLGHQKR